MRSFAGSRLTFLKLGLASAGFGVCVWNSLKATGSQILAFQCDRMFSPVVQSSMYAMINPCIVFDLFCVYVY